MEVKMDTIPKELEEIIQRAHEAEELMKKAEEKKVNYEGKKPME